MIACEFNKMLGRHYDGELSAIERAKFDQHVSACAECSAELERMAAISQALRAEPMPRASAQFMNRLETLADQVEEVMAVRFARRLTAAAAAILLAATLQWALHSPAPAQPVAAVPLAGDERMLVDPEAAASNAVPDNSLALADSALDPLSSDSSSGGRP